MKTAVAAGGHEGGCGCGCGRTVLMTVALVDCRSGDGLDAATRLCQDVLLEQGGDGSFAHKNLCV